MMNFCHYFMLFIIYSFIGWSIEVILTMVKTGKFVNRGFLIGPYCPIYGYGAVIITTLLKGYEHNLVILFILSIVVCLGLEYVTSYLMERIFHARWWDYSNMKYNINGRVCLETAIPFGFGAIFLVYVIQPIVLSFLGLFSHTIMLITTISLFTIFIIDNFVSFNIISKIKKIDLRNYKDNTQEISEKVKDYLKQQTQLTKRLINAFPNLKSTFEEIAKKGEEITNNAKKKFWSNLFKK